MGKSSARNLTGNAAANLLTGGNGGDTLLGQGGNDTLIGNALANRLAGMAGADTVLGGGGADTITGGTGNDSLTGGTGPDRFVFATGDGRDRISDFNATGAAHDRLDIRTIAAVTDFADLRAHHLAAVAGGVEIRISGAQVITLAGAKLADLDAGDFLF